MATTRMSIPPAAAASFAIIAIQILLKKKKKEKSKHKRRWWCRQLFRQRMQYGNRIMKDMQVELVDDIIKNFTRMTLEDFEYLTLLVGPKITRMDTNMREAITAKERLALTLRYLATGDSFTSLQYLFRISKSSISGIIPDVCSAIIDSLREYVMIPNTEEQWLEKANEFKTKWSFPHAIAAMDGKHIMIQAPNLSGSEFYNYKNSFSIVLFALVDANYNFMYVDVGCQGRISDGGVFKNTTLHKKLENRTLNIPNPCALQIPYYVQIPYMILGDKAFALNDYTITPFSGNPDSGSSERVFNYRHSRARRVVENAFGILSAVFRVLRKPMLLQPEVASKVTMATIYLHNFLRSHTSSEIYTPPGSFDTENDGQIVNGRWRSEQPMTSMLPIRKAPRRTSEHAKSIRMHIASHFVLNDVLPWQNIY